MKPKMKSVILIITIIMFTILIVNIYNETTKFRISKDEYYESKSVIVNYFEKLLSKNYHQLELGANDIFFDEKIIKKIRLLEISDSPIQGRADTKSLLEKYNNLDEVLVFEVTYNIKYINKYKQLFQVDDGERTQYITLIKLKNANSAWLIEEIGY